MFHRYLLLTGLVAGSFMVQGCDKIVHEPTFISENKIQIEEERFFENLALSELDDNYVAALSKHYSRHGDGGVDLRVTYDPQSKSHTAMYASQHLGRLSDRFRKNGVSDVDGMIMPVKGQGDDTRVLLSYNSFTASAPKDCGMMPGYSDRNVNPDPDYKLGCTRDTLFAKQIARPKDLRGNAQDELTTDGRRAANIVGRYRSGEPNAPLEGETASE